MSGGQPAAALAVQGLVVRYATDAGGVTAVRGVDLEVAPGRVLALVGESGSGKTATVLGALGLLGPGGRVVAGEVRVAGRPLDRRRRRSVLGRDVGVVFQDPLTSLHPSMTIGAQLIEAVRVHAHGVSRRAARARALELLERVGIPQPADRLDDHPHQWSGGMRQRAMIAMAIAHDPVVLVADEPTTALDVTVQAQILELLASLRAETGTAMVLITHDLGVVAAWADDVVVLHHGRVVERAPVDELFAAPRHPYTAVLLGRREAGATAAAPLPAHAEVEGCAFAPRCPVGVRDERCRTERPELTERDGAAVACHHPLASRGTTS